MKSTFTSTLFFSEKAATCFFISTLPAGTQWSQKNTETWPAA